MKLTLDHKMAMKRVKDGADVNNYVIAKLLREVEKFYPEFIHITEPMMYKGDGTDRVPYFGAILTKKGLKAIT